MLTDAARRTLLLAMGAGLVAAIMPCPARPALAAMPRPGVATSAHAARARVTKLTDGEGSVRTHVATMAFYEGSNENNDLPATFMAANYDWTEQASNSAGAQAATAFHAAGGLHAMAYMDPNAINCSSNQPGSCSDLETRLDNMDETGYLHNQDGSRAYSNGQQRINTLSTAFLTAWPLQVKDFLALSPAWTAAQRGTVEIDTENWVTLAMFAYDGGPFQEITQQPQVTQAQSGVPGYTPNLAVLNGVDYDFPADGYYDQLLDALGTIITGEFNENAFAITYGSGYMTNSYPTTNAWKNQENGILDVVGRKLHDFVWMEGDPSPAHRMYGVASYWLTRRARLSVLWEDFCAPDNTPKGYCNSTWADITVVPRDPLQTATGGSIDTLAVGPLYRREFGACFQAAVPIGQCATVVNPTSSSAPWPALSQTYGHTLVLSTTSLYGGGTLSWVSGVPSSLPPNSAAIVAQ